MHRRRVCSDVTPRNCLCEPSTRRELQPGSAAPRARRGDLRAEHVAVADEVGGNRSDRFRRENCSRGQNRDLFATKAPRILQNPTELRWAHVVKVLAELSILCCDPGANDDGTLQLLRYRIASELQLSACCSRELAPRQMRHCS